MRGRARRDAVDLAAESRSSGGSQSFHDSASRRSDRLCRRCERQHEGLIRIVKLCNHGLVTRTLGADLLAVVARLNRLASQRARIPLPFAQGRLLSTIEDQGAARISDLAALDHCSQPTMTMQVRRLEDAGLVSRTVDPDDARAVLIRITPKGVDMLRQVRVDRGAAIDPYLEQLDAADRQTLDDAVRVMRRLLKDAAAPKPTVK